MELRNLNSFLKVIENGSFSKAANQLGYTQSNVTMQIKQLESELGKPLFDRVGKSISLTPAGKILETYANDIFLTLGNATQALAQTNEPAGELRLGITESLCTSCLPAIMQKYHKLYPDVNIIIKTRTPEELAPLLDHNAIDLMWIFDHEVTNSSWENVFSYQDEIHLIAPTTHPVSRKKDLCLTDLDGETFLFTEKDCSYRNAFEQRLIAAGIQYQIFMEIGNTELIKKFVASGLCLAFLPAFTTKEEYAAGTLVPVPLSDFHLDMYGQIFYHKKKWISPAEKEFCRICEEVMTA